MKVTLELIDELRNRVNVTYEEAKSTLEKNDGDLIKSIIELEGKKGTKKTEKKKEDFTSFIDKLLELKFSVKNKNGDTLINVPVVLVLVTFVMAFWVVIFGVLVTLMTSCKMKIYRDKNSINVHGIKRNMQETVEKIKVKSEEIIKEDEVYTEEKKNDQDENEIIIE
jgi:translation elongation factor EF-Ts